MLEAKKSKWFEKIFAVYNRNLFKRRFSALRVEGIENIKSFPVVIYCNHSSWWDGLVAFEISRISKIDSYIMMEEKQLRHLQLFRKLGAFSVVRENPRKAIESIDYAANLLQEKTERAVWIFPQGKILPNDSRPFTFYNGISRIVEEVGDCYILPIAIRYEFFGEWKPEVLVKIGKSEQLRLQKNKELKENLAKVLETLLDEIKLDIVNENLEHYRNIL